MVAVAGAKGSPGVSFVSAGLACRFASLGMPALAVDADAEGMALAALFDADQAAERPSAGAAALTPDTLRAMALAVEGSLSLLELGRRSDDLDGRAVAGAAREAGFAAVICDLGHQHGPLQKQLAAAADWLVWVVEPDRLGLDRADRALAAPALRGASCGLVLNRLGAHTLTGADRALCAHHELPLLARVPEDRRAASRCTARAPWHRQRKFGAAFEELASALHPDLAGRRGGAWR